MSMYCIFNPTLQQKFKSFKYFMKIVIKKKEKMDEIQRQLDKLDWTEENREQRIRLYQELGRLMEFWRMDKITIKYYRIQLLEEANLTG